MQIQIRWSDVESSDALGKHINEQIKHALRHLEGRFTAVNVHIHDENAGKHGGNDKRCVIEARPAGYDPLSVESNGDDFYITVNAAARKLQAAAESFIEKHRDH